MTFEQTRPLRATAAVVVKDRLSLMTRCLEGLLAQDFEDFEIVIVDNGSTDGTYELVTSAAADARVPVRVVVDRGGLGRIRNRAVAEAAAPIIAFVDSDCVPARSWLRTGVSAFDDRPLLGVVQGKTVPDPDIPMRRWSSTQNLPEFTNRYEACNIFYRVDALKAAGGFDETIGQFGEDTAAGWGVRRLGWDAHFEPDALVEHTVIHPGPGWHMRRALGYGAINALVGQFPEMREAVLWHRVFLRPTTAALSAAVVGVALAPLNWRTLALAAPYLWMRKPHTLHRRSLIEAAQVMAWDASIVAGLFKGTMRTGTVVL